MLTLFNGTFVSEYTAATALTLEARRQGKSYGQLVANTDGWQQQKIVLDYCEQKQGASSRRERPAGKICGDCAMWRRDEDARAGGWCPVPKKGTTGQRYTYRRSPACKQFIERVQL